MSGDRSLSILERLTADLRDGTPVGTSLCTTAVELLDLPGAGLTLMDDEAHQSSMGASGDLMRVVEELQHTHGEGPCIDAHHFGRPVLEPDLIEPETRRWVGFTPPAVDAGARAVFGFPLQVGATSIGALNLSSDRRGRLTERQHADALLLADVSTHAILAVQANAPLEALAAELEDIGGHQVVVHQATGMVAVQTGYGVKDAFARLRAHAYATDQPMSAVGAAIVARRLRLER